MSVKAPIWFDEALQHDVSSAGTRMEVKAGETIIRESDQESRHAFFLLDGKVRVWAPCDPLVEDSSHMVLLDDIEATDIIGEISAIDKKPYTATVETLTKSVLVRVSSDQLMELLRAHTPFEQYIFRRLCEKLRLANEKIRDMRVLSANARVTREVLRLIKFENEDSPTGYIDNFPTHAVLAARCGVRRETVSRTIKTLIDRDLIKQDGKAMLINNKDGLARAYDDKGESPVC